MAAAREEVKAGVPQGGDETEAAIDLARFRREVLAKGGDGCLPCNLSDEWLYGLLAEYEEWGYARDRVPVAALLATTVITIEKAERPEPVRALEFLEGRLTDYLLEILLELLARRTPLSYEEATMDTIFRRREMRIWRRDRPPAPPR